MEGETPAPAPYRPLSGTEHSWYKSVRTGTGVTVLSLLFSRPLSPQILQSALTSLQIAHPVLSSSLSPASLLLPCPPSRLLLSPPAADRPCFLSLLERELNLNPWRDPPASPDVVPNLFATVYDDVEIGPGRAGSVLALRFHTAVCDRTSAVAVLKELLTMVGAGEEEIINKEKGEVRKGIEEMIRREDGWKPFWARGKDVVGYSVNGLRSSGLEFLEVGTERASEVVRLVMGEADTKTLLDACKAKGVKLCGALAAAGLLATYSSKHLDNNQHETYSIVTLIDCRKFLDPPLTDHDIGFYHSAILNTHSIHGGEGLWEVATRCHDAYYNAKNNKKHLTDIGDINFLMCKAIDNPHLTPFSSLRTAVISVFEEPVVYQSSIVHTDLGVEDYVGCASAHGVGPSIAIFDTIRDGQLDCACVYPSPLHSRKQITELVDHMKQILVEGCHDVDVAEGTA